MRGDRGQGTVEWIGLVAAIGTLLLTGVALAQAPFVGRTVTRQYARALCIVRGGDCRRDREPCVTEASRRHDDLGGTLEVFETDAGGGLILEHRSDGTVLVTQLDDGSAGVHAKGGLAAQIQLGRFHAGAGAELSASAIARYGGGRSWVVGSEREAYELLRQYNRTHRVMGGRGYRPRTGPPVRPPDVTYDEAGAAFALDGSAGLKGYVTLAGDLTIDRRAGTRTDHRSGERTVYVQAERTQSVSVLTAGKERGTRDGHTGGDEVYAVVFDRAGRPVDLQISATSTTVPEAALPVGGMLRTGRAPRGTRSYETTAHLDLTEPSNLAAARGLLAAIGHHDGLAASAAAGQVHDRLAGQGDIEVRALDVESGTSGLGGSVTVGPFSLRANYTRVREHSTLLAAQSRGADGQWLPRDDC